MLTSRTLFTWKQKAELWERWKNGLCEFMSTRPRLLGPRGTKALRPWLARHAALGGASV